jgi:hypothetical protein
VSSGLKEGDVIVTNGFINLFDGANVKLKSAKNEHFRNFNQKTFANYRNF